MTDIAQQIPTPLEAPVGWLTGLAALVTAVAVLWKPVRGIMRIAKNLAQFVEDWTGRPERTDRSGRVTHPEKPGVLARMDHMAGRLEQVTSRVETVRHQVENSHKTNLRDDVDRVEAKLDEHISIAQDSDQKLAETAAQVERLHAKWARSAD